MKTIDFTSSHIEQAAQIAKQNYEEERGLVVVLPYVDELPSLEEFAKSNRGIAAVDGEKLLGFFCWLEPWNNHFGVCKGTWSPIHAHGAVQQNRAEIYDRLYQSAAEKLVSLGVLSHSVTLYAHDTAANEIFFQNGFGGRCVDAIRDTSSIIVPALSGVTFRQAIADDAEALAEMNNRLVTHLQCAPIFLPYFEKFSADNINQGIADGYYQYVVAFENNRAVAYIRIQQSGENFTCDDNSMMNISGAYAMPEVRGTGVIAGLLSYLSDWLREHGYSRCGVDFESFNFTARKFWLKYFTAYTSGLVRRIDERIC